MTLNKLVRSVFAPLLSDGTFQPFYCTCHYHNFCKRDDTCPPDKTRWQNNVVSTCRPQTREHLPAAATPVTIISLSALRVGVEPSWPLAHKATVDSAVCVNVCKQRGVPSPQPGLTALPSAGLPGARLSALRCQALSRGCVVTGLRGWLKAGPAN